MAQSLWLLAVVFLSGLPAAQLECPPDKEVPLWNHIHLRKSGNFICWYSCQDIKQSSWSVLQLENHHCGTTSTFAKGARCLWVQYTRKYDQWSTPLCELSLYPTCPPAWCLWVQSTRREDQWSAPPCGWDWLGVPPVPCWGVPPRSLLNLHTPETQ